MSTIIVRDQVYQEISLSAFYESEFENIVIQNSQIIFPEFFFIPFKPSVSTDFDIVKPDFAIIDMKYRNWWVGEIEMGYHQLNQHVLPQVEKLSQGYYGSELIPDFLKQNSNLDPKKISDLLKGKQPSVILLVNTPKPEWLPFIRRFNAIMLVFQVFKSEQDHHIFRINGEYPTISLVEISNCYVDPIVPNFVVLESPAAFPYKNGESFEIWFENGVSNWKRIDIKNKVYIVPIKINPLDKRVVYKINEKNDGNLIFSK
jgi:hypothetical protein